MASRPARTSSSVLRGSGTSYDGVVSRQMASFSQPLVAGDDKYEKGATNGDDGDPHKGHYTQELFSFDKWARKLIPQFPLWAWLPAMNASWKMTMFGDIAGGLTVGALLIPQGIAYALVAKVPPVFGLYSGFVPCIVYSFWGTSGQVSVGPIATISQITSDGASKFFPPMIDGQPNEDYTNLVVLMCLQMGLILLVMGLFGLGFIANFLSHPVIEGYKTGVCFSVGVGQRKFASNRPVAPGTFFQSLKSFFIELPHADGVAIAFSIGTVVIILGFKAWVQHRMPGHKIVKFVPGVLVAVLLGILISFLTDYDFTVGNIPAGVKSPRPASTVHFLDVLPTSIILAIIGYAESVSISVAYAQKHGDIIEPTREFYALAASNILGSFFSSFPVSGTPSRTVISDMAGSRSVGNNIPQGLVVLFGLLFITPLFEILPNPVLGAVVILALAGLVNPPLWYYIYKVNPVEFVVPWVTFIAILIWGIADGIGIGVAFSLFMLILFSAFPGYKLLGRSGGADFNPIYKYDDEAHGIPGVVVFRFEADLHFANYPMLRQQIIDIIARREHTDDPVRHVIIDASGMHLCDSTGVTGLTSLRKALLFVPPEKPDKNTTRLLVANPNHVVRRVLQRGGFLAIRDSDGELFDEHSNFFDSVDDAVLDCKPHQQAF